MSQKVSAIINTKNSSTTLKSALKSILWADEIVIVDMNSSDDTIKIAKEFTDKIYLFDDVGYVEPARNFAIEKCSGDWVFVLDADEEVSSSLAKKIPSLIKSDVDIYDIPRKNIVFNKWMKNTGMWPDYQRRLFKKGHVIWSDKIHSIPEIKGKIEKLQAIESNSIIHHHYQTIEQYIDRLNKYTSIEAEQKSGRTSPEKVLKEAFSEFQKRYFMDLGYQDDMHGIGLSFLQMFYQISVQLKLWQKQGFKQIDTSIDKSFTSIIKELKFWHANYKQKTAKDPISKIYWKIRQKLFL